MEKLLVLYPPQPDLAAFKDYYVNEHLPLARALPGVKALKYSFDVQTIEGGARYDCLFEAEFEDGAAFGLAMTSPAGQRVTSDVPNFAKVPPIVLHYTVPPNG